MVDFQIGLSWLAIILSLSCIFGVAYHKKRITELTFVVGHLLEEIQTLKTEKEETKK